MSIFSCGHPELAHSFQYGCEGLGDWTEPFTCACTDFHLLEGEAS